MLIEAVWRKYMLIESIITGLLLKYCNIKLRNIKGEPTAARGKDVFLFRKLLVKKTVRHMSPEDVQKIYIQ
jgi:hypothetical protein